MLAGMRGYALQQCLKEQRKQREAAGADEEDPPDKYEQPGELVTLPSGEGTRCGLTLTQQPSTTLAGCWFVAWYIRKCFCSTAPSSLTCVLVLELLTLENKPAAALQ
jgi:hypothetical protein